MPGWRSWLRKLGILSDDRAKRIEATQKRDGISFGEALLRENVLDRNGYLKILVTESPYPLATPGMLNAVPPGITNILSSDLVKEFKCFPLWVVGRRLQVAFLDPTDIVAINELCQYSGMEIEPFCCHPDDLFAAIDTTFGSEPTKVEEPEEIASSVSRPPRNNNNVVASTPAVATTPVIASVAKQSQRKRNIFEKLNPFKKEREEITKKIERTISLVPPFEQEEGEKKEEAKKPDLKIDKNVETSLSPFFPPKIEKKIKILTTQPPETKTIFTPEATTDTLNALKKKMDQVKSKDEVAEEILGWLKRQKITRGAILIIQKNLIVGWRGFGYNLEGPSAARIKLPFDEPSVFKTVADTKEFFHGELPKNDVEDNFVTFLQNRPSEIFLTPVILNDRVFGFIYAEPKADETINPTKKILPLAEELSHGFTTLINSKRSS